MTDKRPGYAPEPPPTTKITNFSTSVQYWAQQDALTLQAQLTAAPSRLAVLIEARARAGYEKYGTYLGVENGRNPLNDARDEVLDLLVYAKQDQMGPTPRLPARTYQSILGLAQEVVAICDLAESADTWRKLSVSDATRAFDAEQQVQRQDATIEKLKEQNKLLEDELFKLRGE